jgi:hypothetical protein
LVRRGWVCAPDIRGDGGPWLLEKAYDAEGLAGIGPSDHD